ncbi:MAG: hypothetical protein ISF22_04655 [Methanomassiliicoccus sp.]|nr:hypothetical protein [Methanomassiliicoccus sp.]
MEADARFVHTDPLGKASQGEGKVSVGEDAVVLRPAQGNARCVSLRDIVSIGSGGYKLQVSMVDGSGMELSQLGHRFEDIVRELHRARNELIMKDLLMGERLRKQGVKAELRAPFRGAEGQCEVRLYDTAIVLMPLRSTVARVRYADVRGIEARDYVLRIELDSGEQLVLGMLGRELDPLWKGISDAMAELEANVQATVKDIYPDASGDVLTSASSLLKEGRAASRRDLEGVDPRLFAALEARLRAAGMGGEYDHLTSLGRRDMVRIGLKRSLAKQEEDYIWFMVPILGKEGNAVAMEATSGPSGGRATYFFRIAPRAGYPSMDDDARFGEAERCMDALTAALQDVNFRRQPIYLKDVDLLKPQYSKYRFSVILMPALRDLRDRFIGRVAHTSPEEWTAKVTELLAFNAKARGSEKWASAGEAEESGEED